MTIAVGAVAPELSLEGTDGGADGRRRYSLSDYKGTVVVLVFYPADASPVCTAQLKSYTEDIRQFDQLGAQVLAISPQSVADHEAFAAEHGGFAFPLLADEAQEAARAYEILGPMGFYRRSVFVVDGDGIVRYAHRSTAGMTFRPTEVLLEAIQSASVPAPPGRS